MTKEKATPAKERNVAPGFQEYPKMLYFKGDATKQKTVNSEVEEAAAGSDWSETIVEPEAQ